MITIGVLSMVFCMLSTILSSFILYSMLQQTQKIDQLKSKLTKSQALVESFSTKLSKMDQILKKQDDAEAQLEKLKKTIASRNHVVRSEPVDSQTNLGYERAKDLVRRGIAPDEQIFQKCNLTEEELELLADV